MKFKLSKLIKMACPICAVITIVILYCLQSVVIETYYIESEDITVTSFSSYPKSYVFFNKGNGFKYDSGKDYVYVQCNMYKVVDVYEDSLKFMLFDTGVLDLQSPNERSPAGLSHDEFDEYGLQLFRYDGAVS